jgi:beta-N-acetylhexosaminidase
MNQGEIRQALAQSFVAGIEGTEVQPAELALFSRQGLGGVILFSRNIHSPGQVWRLNSDLFQAVRNAGLPPLFALVDQEGGTVARLKGRFTHGPGFAELGLSASASDLHAHGLRMAQEMRAAGFNWNLAPVMDVNATNQGIMAQRSLGSDPDKVGRLGSAFIKGVQEAGILACAKHFPGLGRTTLDTHRERPRVDLSRAELKAVELPPFRQAIETRVAGIMVCHAVFSALDPQNPASLSPAVIQGLLRTELGFQGLVLSDDLEMGALAASLDPDQAAVQAYLAGCDLLLICHHAEYAFKALDQLVEMSLGGDLPLERVRESHKRILEAKASLSPGPGPLESLTSLLDEHANQPQEMA